MKIPKELNYNQPNAWFDIPHENPNEGQSNEGTSFVSNFPQADVLFFHDTLLEKEGKSYLDPNDEKHRALPLYANIAEASCFSKSARIFQPHYRQLSLAASIDNGNFVFNPNYDIPLDDVIAAYNAYMVNWNMDRPVILAGHGQGALLCLQLLKYLKKTERNFNKLVAAYLIGYTVKEEDLHDCGLPLSSRGDEIRCIVTYNTLAQGAKQGLMLLPGALCTNPLNWCNNRNSELHNKNSHSNTCSKVGYGEKSLHLGMVNFNLDGTGEETPNFTDTWIDQSSGALIVDAYTKQNAPVHPYLPKGDLHPYNYSLFYRNLEQNAMQRVQTYHKIKQYAVYKSTQA